MGVQISEELALGEHADNSLVMTQLKKRLKDPEKPPIHIEVDPATRYAPLEAVVKAWERNMPREEKATYVHPAVQKALAVKEYYDEIKYKGKELISINGKVVGGFQQAGKTDGPGKKKGIGGGKPASRRGGNK